MGAKMGAKKEESAAKPTQITVMLRLAAGGYLVYLAFGLLQEYLKPAGGGKMVQAWLCSSFWRHRCISGRLVP